MDASGSYILALSIFALIDVEVCTILIHFWDLCNTSKLSTVNLNRPTVLPPVDNLLVSFLKYSTIF